MKRNKVIVSRKALLRRINRWLKKEWEQQMFKVRRPNGNVSPLERELGQYFIVEGGEIVERKVDLEAYARRFGVIASFEAVGGEET